MNALQVSFRFQAPSIFVARCILANKFVTSNFREHQLIRAPDRLSLPNFAERLGPRVLQFGQLSIVEQVRYSHVSDIIINVINAIYRAYSLHYTFATSHRRSQ